MTSKRYKLISCEVLFREMCAAIARSPHQVDLEFVPKGLHDLGCAGMQTRLREIVGRVREEDYDAILLGYGLCNHGLVGLAARTLPLVVPRAHDCITLFLGSKERYLEYFHSHPGVYFKTTGWIERGTASGELSQLSIQHKNGMNRPYAELVEKYGEDNAQFLWEELGRQAKHYGQLTYIEMGVTDERPFQEQTRKEAEQRGWKYESLPGDLGLIQRLVNGDWRDSEVLVVPPGHALVAKHDEGILAAEPIRQK
ncbi:MAG: DUF1638 domain-containing protein [Verrucomicrobiae bacterium]|nr:DUF1638 domain-containing protein [Verrucomicrobiae bacterium]